MIIFAVLQTAITCILLYVIGAGIYYYTNQDELPPDWWPDWLKNIVHTYPPDYKVCSNAFPVGSFSNSFTSNTATDCARRDTYGCDSLDECIGFTHFPSANTCYLFSNTLGIVVSNGYAGKYYAKEGSEISKGFIRYGSNTSSIASTFASYTVPISFDVSNLFLIDEANCAANCFSNSACNGFVFAQNLCSQKSTLTINDIQPVTRSAVFMKTTPTFQSITF